MTAGIWISQQCKQNFILLKGEPYSTQCKTDLPWYALDQAVERNIKQRKQFKLIFFLSISVLSQARCQFLGSHPYYHSNGSAQGRYFRLELPPPPLPPQWGRIPFDVKRAFDAHIFLSGVQYPQTISLRHHRSNSLPIVIYLVTLSQPRKHICYGHVCHRCSGLEGKQRQRNGGQTIQGHRSSVPGNCSTPC